MNLIDRKEFVKLFIADGRRMGSHSFLMLVLILTFFTLPSISAHAEGNELFTPISATQLSRDVNPSQMQYVDRVKKRPTTASVSFVSMNVNAQRVSLFSVQ